MAELKCRMHESSDCEYHHYEAISNGRIAKDGATLYCHIPPNILCVNNEQDVNRLKRLGFNKFIINTNWDREAVSGLHLDNSDIMLELSNEDSVTGSILSSHLSEWVSSGFAGGAGGDFHAIFLNEPTRNDRINYQLITDIIHRLGQRVALGEYMKYYYLSIIDNPFSGDEGDRADLYFYTGYDAPWFNDRFFNLSGMADSDQRYYWFQLARSAGHKGSFPFIKLSHTVESSGHIFPDSYTDVDYLDTHLGTAKVLFNGAVAYPFEIRDEVVLDLLHMCAKSHDLYGNYDHLNALCCGYEGSLVDLWHKSPATIKRCICERWSQLSHNHLAYLTTYEDKVNSDVNNNSANPCSKEDIALLQAAYCEIFWHRMELFSAAAERQGLLESTHTNRRTVYYCSKSDCTACSGTDPFRDPDYWQLSRPPLCQRQPADLTKF